MWRFLHVEADSMGPAENNFGTPGYITDFTGPSSAVTEFSGISINLDDGSDDLDPSTTAVAGTIENSRNGRYENDTIGLIGAFAHIAANGDHRVVPTEPVAIVPLSFSAIDSDSFWNGTMSGTVTAITKGSGGGFTFDLDVTAHNENPIDWQDFIGGKITVAGGEAVTITGG